MTQAASETPCTLITGATGFIGHYVLAALLRRRVRCAVLLRPDLDDSLHRLTLLLARFGLDLHEQIEARRLVPMAGDLVDALPDPAGLCISSIIHIAGSTRFETDMQGEPSRTNVLGTKRLLDWADTHCVRSMHLVSSAYQCGCTTCTVLEARRHDPTEFHNEYEWTKWESERLCSQWADQQNRSLTVYRPSVVVGAFEDGHATKFSGLYLSARAMDVLSESLKGAPMDERLAVSLRLKGRPTDCQNIVPVDYVASMIAAVYCNPADHGQVYHLTHPNPPTNQQLKESLEAYFGIGGGRWVSPEDFLSDDLNRNERAFYEISRPIEHYFVDTPDFERGNTARVESKTGIACPSYDEDSLCRLFGYAQSSQWGRKPLTAPTTASFIASDPACAAYFESFLPTYVSRSQVAQMTGLSTTVRFIVEDVVDGQWVCRFDDGRLTTVHRGSNGLREDVAYRTTREVFWRSVSGGVHPQDLFLSGDAEITGDVEQGLKLAMILYAFTQEFPCDRQTLLACEAPKC